MDARIIPTKILGLKEGEAHVIRNAGGRVSPDAIRSLIISYKLLRTKEWYIIHHTNCGMESVTNEIMADLLSRSSQPATFENGRWHVQADGTGSNAGSQIDFLPIENHIEVLIKDVQKLCENPLIPKFITIYGFIFDVKTGKLNAIEKATRK